MKALLIGLAVTNQAVARGLLRRGHDVVACDDAPAASVRSAARDMGIELLEAPAVEDLRRLVRGADAVFPSPGVPARHRVFALARELGVPVRSEFDLAAEWDARPVVAITGTDGKTTVTTLVAAMLEASGRRAAAVGNTETPLVAAIDDPATDVFVVEASSFRLEHSGRFAPRVGTWLNFAPDHLEAHASLADYERAKARIWRDQGAGDLAVANADDPVVMKWVPAAGPDVVTFGLTAGDYRSKGATLFALGEPVVEAGELWRALPHDIANALAATATALGGGASMAGCRDALRSFRGLPHRVTLVGEHGEVRWYDDSKATTPHATLAAVRGFPSVVLIAGGRNKGLALSALAAEVARIRAVVAIGEAAADIERAFTGVRPVTEAGSMADAVARAAEFAEPGDAVLLSPACASFDWYSSYAERGDDFARLVHQWLGVPR
ncbi:MAG: UDP-N-acetylmuramoyl-L-alanine--D-glutamate ligase [Acidimicrobiales bacterium]